MKIALTTCALLIMTVLAGCSSKTPYEIINRNEEQSGLVISYRVGVPQNHTRDDLQGWCNDITASEGSGKVVNIEFVDENLVGQQRALCVSGKLMTVGDLHRQFGEEPQITTPPGMAPVPPNGP